MLSQCKFKYYSQGIDTDLTRSMIIFLIFVVNALVNDKSALSIVLDNSL
ncbi:hypothetical protein [Rickettsia rickettsii]